MGGDPLTFAGLAGMGDLIATCVSSQSRNNRVGTELGKGRSLDDIISEMNMVAEGVKTTRAVLDLAKSTGSRCRSPTRWVGCCTKEPARATRSWP